MASGIGVQRPLRHLITVFTAWKLLLVVIATFSPGPGYDTSSLILFSSDTNRAILFASFSRLQRLMLNVLRWDAVYFIKAAQRGYIHEQEWAFSWAYTRIIRALTWFMSGSDKPYLQHYILSGVVVSNLCHLGSVIVLYHLIQLVVSSQTDHRVPYIAAFLHVISPAGLFLLSPYTEAPFALFNISGMLLYAYARSAERHGKNWGLTQDVQMLCAGVLFAAATLMRSNGILSGLILLFDALCISRRAVTLQLKQLEARRLVVTCVAGSLLALGFIIPQLLAYKEYCVTSGPDSSLRPWCSSTIPSIYSFVQSHYWNVGFLRYWTLSNLPLFLVATPMLWLLFESSARVLRDLWRQDTAHVQPLQGRGSVKFGESDTMWCNLPQLALPQLVLAITTMTSFHVQIINRLASGYPLWYLLIAKWLTDAPRPSESNRAKKLPQWSVRVIVIYALIQGALFANFLPPA